MLAPDDQLPSRIGLVLLAAGASTRLGSPKQLVLYLGKSLLRHATETAISAGFDPVIVVLGSEPDRLLSELADLPVAVALNDEWEEGMSSSIRCGVAALEHTGVSAAALSVCDQPHVTEETYRQLVESFLSGPERVAVSDYGDGATGPPSIFECSLFSELLALQGQQGAKPILKRLARNEILGVPFYQGRIDIDTPADVATLERPS